MLFECWLQLRNEAPADRQIVTDRSLGLTQTSGASLEAVCRSSESSGQTRITHVDTPSLIDDRMPVSCAHLERPEKKNALNNSLRGPSSRVPPGRCHRETPS